MLRIAHVSDLHVLTPRGFEWRRVLFNKRVTGYANLLLHRGRVFRRDYLDLVLSAAAAWADHVVVTGDVTNLALEREFEQARTLLDALARRVEVTVVPGSLDVHLPPRHRGGRVDAFAASAAALDHPGPAVRARFNAYAFGDDGALVVAEAHVVAPDGCTLHRTPLDGGKEPT